MNYGKDATEKRLQAVNSRSCKYRSRIFLTFLKTCCVLCLFSVLVISSIGIGIVMGIIDNSPDLNVDSIVPIGYATTVYDSAGNLTDTLVTAGSNREEATYDELPQDLINAFVAIEDSRFWTHNGIDLRSISRAAVGVLTGENRGGGSTITQQLIKNNMFNGGMETSFGAKLERKLQVMEYEKDRQMMEYDVLQEKERAVARLAHDYKNQLAVGLTLLEQKDYDRLADQLRDLSDSLTTTETVHFCANPVVNAVLANKAALCRRENITLEASLDVPEATGLSDGELCSVFANLLDNAIKAVRPLPPDQRRICIKAGPDGGSLLLKTENPYDPAQYRKGKGLGQGIVRDIAKAHDGDFLALPQGEKFVCLLSLQLVQEQT